MIKFYLGQVIKDYISLCKILNVKPTRGQHRSRHIRELARYCTFHKEGRKFIIDEVFDKPKPKIDERKNNGKHISHTTYGKLMDDLILEHLSKCNINSGSFSGIFTEYIPIFNSYGYGELMKVGYKKFAEKHNIASGLVKTYSENLYQKVKKNFESSMKRLQKENLITFSKDKVLIRNKTQRVEKANIKETQILKECEETVMVKMGLKSRYISNSKIKEKFKENTIKEFNIRNNDGIYSYWNEYSFDLVNEDIEVNPTDINELCFRFIKEIHKSIKNKTYTFNGKDPFKPYRADVHQINTYKLDKIIWNLPNNWYENFIEDYEYIFPDEGIPF